MNNDKPGSHRRNAKKVSTGESSTDLKDKARQGMAHVY